MLQLGLIGRPIGHSLSPFIHEKLMDMTGVKGEYVLYEAGTGSLESLLQYLGNIGCTGINLTTPFKTEAVALMNDLDPSAKISHAVNTISLKMLRDENRCLMRGYNTDVAGFLTSLPKAFKAALANKRILVIGAGGAARAVTAALLRFDPPALTVATRSVMRQIEMGRMTRDLIKIHLLSTRVQAVAFKHLPDLAAFDFVIQCTPVGTDSTTDSPIDLGLVATLPPHALVYDLIYHPSKTALLQAAEDRGLVIQNGLEMLVRQAAASFELWTGKTVTEEMRQSIMKALAEQQHSA